MCYCKNVLCCNGKTVHPLKSTIYNFGNKYFSITNIAVTDFQCNMAEACPSSQRGRRGCFFQFLALSSSQCTPASHLKLSFLASTENEKLDILYFAKTTEPPSRKSVELRKLATKFQHSANMWQTHVFRATELHARFKD